MPGSQAPDSGTPPSELGGRLAAPEVLRRIEVLAAVWTVAAAAGLAVASAGDGPVIAAVAAVVLTAVSALSIVAFRGLQRIVSALGPAQESAEDDGEPKNSAPGHTEDQREHRTIGWRQGLMALVRLCLLGALVAGGASLLGPRHAPALVLGFSTLPAALMTEGLLQMVRALRGKEHDGFS